MPARIFVPTKGRDRRRKWFWDRVPEAELVIEPQDCDRYEGLHYHVLPENDRGIGFARNWVWQLTDEPFWLIDDDVCGIAEWTDRLQTIPIVEGLDRMEEYANSIDPGSVHVRSGVSARLSEEGHLPSEPTGPPDPLHPAASV
jgi:hypothetical protein